MKYHDVFANNKGSLEKCATEMESLFRESECLVYGGPHIR